MCIPGVERAKWDRLIKDGAVLKEVAIDPEIAPTDPRWKYMMSKLEMLRFLEYDKFLFVDADTLIMEPMEDIFQDPGAKVVKTLNVTMTDLISEEPELPEDYLWASVDDLMGHGFERRDAWSRYRYFNGGMHFCVILLYQ
jgi:alpha-N-acetylglucosamine transferase